MRTEHFISHHGGLRISLEVYHGKGAPDDYSEARVTHVAPEPGVENGCCSDDDIYVYCKTCEVFIRAPEWNHHKTTRETNEEKT